MDYYYDKAEHTQSQPKGVYNLIRFTGVIFILTALVDLVYKFEALTPYNWVFDTLLIIVGLVQIIIPSWHLNPRIKKDKHFLTIINGEMRWNLDGNTYSFFINEINIVKGNSGYYVIKLKNGSVHKIPTYKIENKEKFEEFRIAFKKIIDLIGTR
jgi:hypothetical protein